jgi:hypothetical protein
VSIISSHTSARSCAGFRPARAHGAPSGRSSLLRSSESGLALTHLLFRCVTDHRAPGRSERSVGAQRRSVLIKGSTADHQDTPRASRWARSRGFSGSGRPCEAASSAARVAVDPLTSWLCAWLPGWHRGLRSLGSAFVVVGRGCATTGLLRGDHRVGVLRLPPTARAGWRRNQPE